MKLINTSAVFIVLPTYLNINLVCTNCSPSELQFNVINTVGFLLLFQLDVKKALPKDQQGDGKGGRGGSTGGAVSRGRGRGKLFCDYTISEEVSNV